MQEGTPATTLRRLPRRRHTKNARCVFYQDQGYMARCRQNKLVALSAMEESEEKAFPGSPWLPGQNTSAGASEAGNCCLVDGSASVVKCLLVLAGSLGRGGR